MTHAPAFAVPLPLGIRSVHVWSLYLEQIEKELTALEGILDDEERERAQRFVRAPDRIRFIASHGILRRILGRYLGVAASSVRFQSTEFGKPFVPGSKICFNLTHTDDLVAVAVAKDRAVGIDVENGQREVDCDGLMRSQFSAGENQRWSRLAPADKTRAFFECWTRKESYVKARGVGLSYPLTDFTVAYGPRERPRLLAAADDRPDRWSFFDLDFGRGYVGALVAEGSQLELERYTWSGDC